VTTGQLEPLWIRMEPFDLPPVFVPVFKLDLNPILNCLASTEALNAQQEDSLRCRGQAIETAVGPDRVVLLSPVLNHNLRLLQRKE
jgi:hypothetical protein